MLFSCYYVFYRVIVIYLGGACVGNGLLKIGQVAKLSGLSSRTIDYYSQCGLLDFERTDANYRLYSRDMLQRLERIKLLKEQKHSINEIRQIITETEHTAYKDVLDDLNKELNYVHDKITILDELLRNVPKEDKESVYYHLTHKMNNIRQLLL